MVIENARYAGGEIHLRVDPRAGIRAVNGIKTGRDYELKPVQKKRGLTANAYAWTLIRKVAEALGDPPLVVYRRYIRDVGCRVSIVHVPEEDVERETRDFVEGHYGRLVSVGDSEVPGCVALHKKYGSSDYTAREMARFIDAIVQDCREMGIETRPQWEVDSLLASWEDRR